MCRYTKIAFFVEHRKNAFNLCKLHLLMVYAM